MTPVIEHYSLIVGLYWLAMVPVAVFILTQVTGYFTGEYPENFRKALATVLLVAAAVFFTYDLSGYYFFRLMQDPDLGIRLPPGYGYWNWLHEPMALKWHALGIVPVIRFLPVIFALCVGGTLQVFLWKVPYRVGVVVFVAELFLCLVAMTLLSFVFRLGIGVYERTTGAEPVRVHPREPEEAPDARGEPPSFAHLVHRVRRHGPERDTVWHRLNSGWESFNQHLQPLYGTLEPVTRHLPAPAQDFLNSGGWVLVLGGLAVLVPLWPRVHRHRHHLHRRTHAYRHPAGPPHDRLSLIGDALTGLGPHQATVRGVPARLRLVVLAPADKAVEKVTTEMTPRVLDHILPGLGQVAAYDAPRIEVWDDARPRDHFRQAFLERVEVPEPPGAPSRWVLLDGEAAAAGSGDPRRAPEGDPRRAPEGDPHRALLHVGLALFVNEPTSRREVAVPPGRWSETLGLRAVPANEQD